MTSGARNSGQEDEPPRWLAALFRQHSEMSVKVDAMAKMLQDIRDEEAVEHAKINDVLSTLTSTADEPGAFERLRQVESSLASLREHVKSLENTRERDIAEQAALGKRVQVTIVALVLAIVAASVPAVAKLMG